MMASHRNKTHTLDNIEFLVSIGEFKLRLSLPKNTTVQGLLSVVRGYEALHDQYGPQGTHFLGLAAQHTHPILDYWLSQPQLDFMQFRKRLELKCLYSSQRRSSHLTLNEFQFLICLGKGACGSVYLVRSRITGCVLALKRVSKQGITNYNALMTQFRERKNMIRLGSNSHTVTLHATFQSRQHFNFLLDYYPGGELFLHLTQRLSMNDIKRYFCEILLSMEYIHRKKVLYRDLKPENIFVDLKGHLRIGDFGMSKCDFEEDDFAASVCGSAEYMAPQILQNKDYNFSADFYSIGALLYQLLTGYPPHYDHAQNQQKLKHIKKMDLRLQQNIQQSLRQLLVNLLHPDPEQRISNFQQIKNSGWLGGVDWKVIENKQELMPLAVDPNEIYIADQFLKLQREVDQINYHFHDDSFTSDIADAFEYVRPESRKLIGLQLGFPQPKLVKKVQQRPEKKHIVKKANLSIAQFQKEESTTEISSTQGKIVKEKESKQLNKENKQNRENLLRRDNSKKNLSKQGSQLILLGKSTVTASNAQLVRGQKSQRILLTNNSHNNSEWSAKNVSHGKETVRIRISDMRDGKSKCRSKQKSVKQSSIPKVNMLKRKEQKKTFLPTCSYRIKLT